MVTLKEAYDRGYRLRMESGAYTLLINDIPAFQIENIIYATRLIGVYVRLDKLNEMENVHADI